jgi:hypothetical protein
MVEAVPGEMEELAATATRIDKQQFWSMCVHKMEVGGWSRGRALATYKNKFGVWPKGLNNDTILAPDVAFEKTVKAQIIRYLKSKKRAA